jgi:hypothetical protein
MTYGEWVDALSNLGYSESEISDVLKSQIFTFTDESDIYTVTETEL